MEKWCKKKKEKKKKHQKPVRGPIFNFVKYPKTVIACKKFFWKEDVLKED